MLIVDIIACKYKNGNTHKHSAYDHSKVEKSPKGLFSFINNRQKEAVDLTASPAWVVPLTGFEPATKPFEGFALSTELQG